MFISENEFLCFWHALQVGNASAVLGFVGAPFTLASYIVEGGSSKHFTVIKRMAFESPEILHSLLQKLAESVIIYVRYQADCGAQAVQIFDSWATQLSPVDFEVFSLPYIKQIVSAVKATHPDLPLILYASGSGGLLERMASTGVDVVSVDWTVDMAEARQRIGTQLAVQVIFFPTFLLMYY
jgi:uroporphyrinogen decarboxylase